MDFTTAVRTCLGKYGTFTGRAPRSEYWFFVLFEILISIAAGICDGLLAAVDVPFTFFTLLVSLALILPGLSVSVRRLHDRDKSGWWYLLALVPLVGIIVLLIWFCSKGTDGPNRFGDDPLATIPHAPSQDAAAA